MSVPYWKSKQENRTQNNYDICIVGGGISGLSVAYWLQKEDPSLRVAILEKNQIGDGATSRNAGFITCGSVEHFNRMVSKHGEEQALEIWRYAETNMELLKKEIIGDASDLEFEQKGAFSLAASESEFSELKNVAKLMEKHGIPVEVLDEPAVKKRVGAEGFVGGIKYIKDGAIHPLKLLNQVRSKLTCDIFENSEVFAFGESDGRRTVKTAGGDYHCDLVILAANGYLAGLDPYFEDKVYPTRGQIMMLESVPKFMEAPCYANFYLDYFRQSEDGSLLIGGFRQLEKDTEKGFSDHTTETIQQALHEFVIMHLPGFKDARVVHRWAGVMGFSSDGEPLVGSLPTDNQVFFMGGFTGHGLGLSFHTAKSLVDLAFGRSIPDWLSAKRF